MTPPHLLGLGGPAATAVSRSVPNVPCPPPPPLAAAGTNYIRTTHFELHCDATVKGFAQLYDVVQDPDNGCDYTLRFHTNAVCYGGVLGGLSGGWMFNILLFTVAGVYLVAGGAWSWFRNKAFGHPHAEFWSGINDLIVDGIVFSLSGCRARRGRAAMKIGTSSDGAAPMFGGSGAETAAPAFGGSSVKGAYTDL